MIFNILDATIAFINLLSQQNTPAVDKILSSLQHRTKKANNWVKKGYRIQFVNVAYLPTQWRKVLNKEGKNTLLANLKGYLQNLLLIWFHFSITSKRMPQCKYVFLSILESLTAHTQIHEQHAFCTMVFSVHKNSIRAQHINQRTTKTVN